MHLNDPMRYLQKSLKCSFLEEEGKKGCKLNANSSLQQKCITPMQNKSSKISTLKYQQKVTDISAQLLETNNLI